MGVRLMIGLSEYIEMFSLLECMANATLRFTALHSCMFAEDQQSHGVCKLAQLLWSLIFLENFNAPSLIQLVIATQMVH